MRDKKTKTNRKLELCQTVPISLKIMVRLIIYSYSLLLLEGSSGVRLALGTGTLTNDSLHTNYIRRSMKSENQPGNKMYFSLLHTFSVLELLRKKLWDMMSLNVLQIPKRTSRCLFVHFFFLSNLFLKKSRAMIILQEGPLFQSQGPCKSNGGITATPNRQRVDSCCH